MRCQTPHISRSCDSRLTSPTPPLQLPPRHRLLRLFPGVEQAAPHRHCGGAEGKAERMGTVSGACCSEASPSPLNSNHKPAPCLVCSVAIDSCTSTASVHSAAHAPSLQVPDSMEHACLRNLNEVQFQRLVVDFNNSFGRQVASA
jgi:hypothetical protein